MVVNPEKNLLFIHNPKTAGTSIKHLISHLGTHVHTPEILDHLEARMGSRLPAGHIPAWVVYEVLPELRSKPDPIHFGVVRNPWDRAHSMWRWCLDPRHPRHREFKGMSFSQFIRHRRWDTGTDSNLWHQWWYFSNESDRYVPTEGVFIMRFEDLTQQWRKFVPRLREPVALDLPRIRATGENRDYVREYLRRPDCLDIVTRYFRDDIEIFGYWDQKPA